MGCCRHGRHALPLLKVSHEPNTSRARGFRLRVYSALKIGRCGRRIRFLVVGVRNLGWVVPSMAKYSFDDKPIDISASRETWKSACPCSILELECPLKAMTLMATMRLYPLLTGRVYPVVSEYIHTRSKHMKLQFLTVVNSSFNVRTLVTGAWFANQSSLAVHLAIKSCATGDRRQYHQAPLLVRSPTAHFNLRGSHSLSKLNVLLCSVVLSS